MVVDLATGEQAPLVHGAREVAWSVVGADGGGRHVAGDGCPIAAARPPGWFCLGKHGSVPPVGARLPLHVTASADVGSGIWTKPCRCSVQVLYVSDSARHPVGEESERAIGESG